MTSVPQRGLLSPSWLHCLLLQRWLLGHPVGRRQGLAVRVGFTLDKPLVGESLNLNFNSKESLKIQKWTFQMHFRRQSRLLLVRHRYLHKWGIQGENVNKYCLYYAFTISEVGILWTFHGRLQTNYHRKLNIAIVIYLIGSKIILLKKFLKTIPICLYYRMSLNF